MNPSPRDPSSRPSAYRYLVVLVLVLVYMANFLDRQIMSLLAEPIKRDLNLSDTQLGMLSGLAFAVFYATLGLPVARLADRHSRVRIIAAACAVWSLFTAACGLATNFLQLAIARMGVGVGEAGGSPPSYSLISDYFRPNERGLAMALYTLGVPLGSTLGTAFGGWVASQYGWRAAFFAAGAPGIILVLLLLVVVREPVRGGLDSSPKAQGDAATSLVGDLRAFFANRTLALTAVSSGLSAFVAYGVSSWAPTFLIRVHGMSLSEVALYYSLVNGSCLAIGIFLSGWLSDRLARWTPRSYALVPAISVLIAIPFFIGFLLAPSWQAALVWMIPPALALNMYLAPALSIVQNAVAPGQRSTAGAIHLFVLNLVGLGGGPLLVGMVSDRLHGRFGDSALGWGLAALVPVMLAAISVLYVNSRRLRRVLEPA